MTKSIRLSILMLMVAAMFSPSLMGQEAPHVENDNSNKLVVVWTSGDIEVAEKMVFMYVYNAKKAKWFDEVTFIVWGPSAKLLSENEKLQASLKKMQEVGIKTEACIACARMYQVDNDLKELGIDVKGMGTVLTKYLKEGYKVMTY